MFSFSRRRILQAGLAASAALLPPYARVLAQSEGAAKLLRLPRVALVVGNAGYARVPALANPANDARAIAAALKLSGFEVDVRLDTRRAEMVAAAQAYVKALADRKCIGVFYFAGHGLQLAWRNYVLPVDAAIGGVDDIRAQGFDVSALVDGIKRAANPMNVIILDACRENPFGDVRVEQKGLSQMDAPSGTLLAYATAPGNLASDGADGNGLYTSHLLREMRVPEAKIEDVFKRVRLGVRLASHGRQIPWESTSLEEDFYFIPPESLRKLSRDQEERLFAEERSMYEKARDARDAAALQAYLHRHPSGHFVELAQLQLDLILAAQGEKRIETASSEGNPNTVGSARADTRFKVGDRWVYRVTERSGREFDAVQEVTGIDDLTVEINGGAIALDLLGNLIRLPGSGSFRGRQDTPLEYAIGKRWSTRYDVTGSGLGDGSVNLTFRILAREKVTVPAGTFDCFRMTGKGYNESSFRPAVEITLTYWRSPQLRRPVAFDEYRSQRGNVISDRRFELKSWREV